MMVRIYNKKDFGPKSSPVIWPAFPGSESNILNLALFVSVYKQDNLYFFCEKSEVLSHGVLKIWRKKMRRKEKEGGGTGRE